jgi:hypothetical protein
MTQSRRASCREASVDPILPLEVVQYPSSGSVEEAGVLSGEPGDRVGTPLGRYGAVGLAAVHDVFVPPSLESRRRDCVKAGNRAPHT